MICLGVESTAHTFGIGIVKDKKILANTRDMYRPAEGSGIVPADAASHHRKVGETVLERALTDANLELKDIDLVAIASGPGLPPCLVAGLEFAKTLNKPMAGVNHCVAHIEIGKYATNAKDPLTVYVSGGNTQLMALKDKRYRVFGETLDIGIGNAIDKFGRGIGLEMPGGPKVEHLGLKGSKYIELPYSVKGMDLTFSGLVTAGLVKAKKASKEDICYSFQETIFAMLTEVTERALAHTEKKEVMLTGGVAQNKRLAQMLENMTKEHSAKFYVTPREFCGDNGAMIAYTGCLKKQPDENIDINSRWRTDETHISWS